jgi:predicted nucleic acid-binding protein
MIIVDTSVWIEFFKGNEPVFHRMEALLENREIIALEPVFGELLQGAKNNRQRRVIIDYWKNTPRNDESEHWIVAGLYAGEKKLFAKGVGLIDSYIIVASLKTNARVWTFDEKLNKVLQPEFIYKE